MAIQQNFVDQLKAQSDVWKAQVKDYQEQLEQMGEKARGDYEKAMAQMKAKAEEAGKLAE
jgi:cell division protein FtsB